MAEAPLTFLDQLRANHNARQPPNFVLMPAAAVKTTAPTKWTCDLNGVPVYVYSGSSGTHYIAIEKSKGLRAAFPDERLKPFEIDINTLVNPDGQLIKIPRLSPIGSCLVGSYHRQFIRVSDLRYILLNVCTAFGTDEVDKILADFAMEIEQAEKGIQKPIAKRRRQKRDRSSDDEEDDSNSTKKSTTDQMTSVVVESLQSMATRLEKMEERLNATTLMINPGETFIIDVSSKDPSVDQMVTFRALPPIIQKRLITQYIKSNEWQKMKQALEKSTQDEARREVLQAFNQTAAAEIEKVRAQAKADFDRVEVPKLREDFWNSLRSKIFDTSAVPLSGS